MSSLTEITRITTETFENFGILNAEGVQGPEGLLETLTAKLGVFFEKQTKKITVSKSAKPATSSGGKRTPGSYALFVKTVSGQLSGKDANKADLMVTPGKHFKNPESKSALRLTGENGPAYEALFGEPISFKDFLESLQTLIASESGDGKKNNNMAVAGLAWGLISPEERPSLV